jgi:Gamma-glutamyl cyclotransferase, AIG2-like
MLHFAYGSNMHVGLMRGRCPDARVVGRAVLRDHRFLITRDGYASVTAARGGVVHGLLWRISPRDLAALDAYFAARCFRCRRRAALQKLLSISAAAGLPAAPGRGIWSLSRQQLARPGFPPITSPASRVSRVCRDGRPSRRTE